MYLKLVLAGCCAALCGFAKADVVVLQNLNPYYSTTNAINGSVYFQTAASSSSLSKFILFGTAGQTDIRLKFEFDGQQTSSAVTANEISAGKYAFDLSAVAGTSSFSGIAAPYSASHFLVFKDQTSYPHSRSSQFFTTSPATMTQMNSSGFTGYGEVGSFMFQFEGNSTTAVPEPSTLILTATALTAGAVGAWIKRRRQKSAETVESDKLS